MHLVEAARTQSLAGPRLVDRIDQRPVLAIEHSAVDLDDVESREVILPPVVALPVIERPWADPPRILRKFECGLARDAPALRQHRRG